MNATHGDADRTGRCVPSPTITYYRWYGVLITDRLLVVGHREYLVAGLCDVGYRTRVLPRAYELHAEYQGALILLLTERDGLRFGQICRALTRAMEKRRTYG